MKTPAESTVSHELEVDSHKSEAGVNGYQSTVLSCIVRCRYQAVTSEDAENVFAVVICRVCRLQNVI
jgi:hypothetical protein